jgi:hypothetical protein
MNITVKKIWTITRNFDDSETTWCPTFVDVDNSPFILINTYDRTFYSICYGKNVRWLKGASQILTRNEFIKQIRTLRQQACDAALAEALKPEDGDVGNHAKKRRNKTRVAKKTDSHLLPEVVSVCVDGFSDDLGVLGPMSFNVLTCDFTSRRRIWVELKEDTIDFIIRSVRLHRSAPTRAGSAASPAEGDEGDRDVEANSEGSDSENN